MSRDRLLSRNFPT